MRNTLFCPIKATGLVVKPFMKEADRTSREEEAQRPKGGTLLRWKWNIPPWDEPLWCLSKPPVKAEIISTLIVNLDGTFNSCLSNFHVGLIKGENRYYIIIVISISPLHVVQQAAAGLLTACSHTTHLQLTFRFYISLVDCILLPFFFNLCATNILYCTSGTLISLRGLLKGSIHFNLI